jgi:hypothetical protein
MSDYADMRAEAEHAEGRAEAEALRCELEGERHRLKVLIDDRDKMRNEMERLRRAMDATHDGDYGPFKTYSELATDYTDALAEVKRFAAQLCPPGVRRVTRIDPKTGWVETSAGDGEPLVPTPKDAMRDLGLLMGRGEPPVLEYLTNLRARWSDHE